MIDFKLIAHLVESQLLVPVEHTRYAKPSSSSFRDATRDELITILYEYFKNAGSLHFQYDTWLTWHIWQLQGKT